MAEMTPKRRVLSNLAAVARALGHEYRLEILEHLAQGARSVEALAAVTGLSVATTSQHLQRLRRGGLVAGRRQGRQIVYRLAPGPIVQAVSALRDIAEGNLAEVRDIIAAYFSDIDSIEPVSNGELARRIEDGSTIVLDVRPADEYRHGHVAGAVNMPLAVLRKRISQLPRNNEIVAYCRGPYCILSFEAVRLLRRRGYKVRRMKYGYPEWQAEGRQVAIE